MKKNKTDQESSTGLNPVQKNVIKSSWNDSNDGFVATNTLRYLIRESNERHISLRPRGDLQQLYVNKFNGKRKWCDIEKIYESELTEIDYMLWETSQIL